MQISKVRQTLSQGATRRQVSILMSVMLLLSTFLASGSRAHAQVECLGICEQQLAECVANSGNSPQTESGCIDNYEACVNKCLSSFALLLE